jgi:methyl-accepting chemotaxis protein
MVDDRQVKVELLHGIKNDANVIARAMRNAALLDDPAEIRKELERIRVARADIDTAQKKLADGIRSEGGKTRLADMVAARATYATAQARFLELVSSDKVTEARTLLFGAVRPAQNIYFAKLDDLVTFQKELMARSAVDTRTALDSVELAAWVLSLFAAVMGIGMAGWIIRSITAPLLRAVSVAQSVARGDLTQVIEAHGKNETAQLLGALRDMQSALSGVVSGVRQNADSVATASGQISQGNNDLSSAARKNRPAPCSRPPPR